MVEWCERHVVAREISYSYAFFKLPAPSISKGKKSTSLVTKNIIANIAIIIKQLQVHLKTFALTGQTAMANADESCLHSPGHHQLFRVLRQLDAP
jgi:hypothetical protein